MADKRDALFSMAKFSDGIKSVSDNDEDDNDKDGNSNAL
jgi:hypothetical protein